MKLSLPMVLFLIFMVLKLCGVIAWSWWWITAPIWGTSVVLIGCVLLYTLMLGKGFGGK